MLRILWPLISLLSFANAQDLLTILSLQPSLSQFTSYISQYPTLVQQLNGGNFTVFAPSNAAFTTYTDQHGTTGLTNDTLKAVLEYHCANDIFASATFSTGPYFPATLLSNKTYTNVTGGQVVEITTSSTGKAVVLSAIRAVSNVIQPDIFFIGGLVQIVDTVLTIPVSFPATITQAGLSDLVALLNKGGWLSPTSSAVGIVNGLSDLTIFAPNSPQYGASFAGWNGLSTADLDSIFEYSIVQGSVVYSTDLKNNSHYKTLEGSSVTITVTNDNQSYVDQALVTTKDYLTANGVFQILDQPLNPNNTGQTPAYKPPPQQQKPSSKGLSSVAAAGIGIAVAAVVIAAVIVGLLMWRRKHRASTKIELYPRIPSRGEILEESVELDGKTITGRTIYEVGAPRTPPEIDGRERSRISITMSGPPPKHVGFQAKY